MHLKFHIRVVYFFRMVKKKSIYSKYLWLLTKKKKKKKNPLLPTKFFESLIIRFRKVGWALTLFSALEPRLDRNWKFFQLFITFHSRTGCFIWIEKTKESGNSSYYSMFNLIVLTCKSKLVSEVIYFIWKIKTSPLPSKKVN